MTSISQDNFFKILTTIEKINCHSISLAKFNELQDKILQESISLFNCDGGTIYKYNIHANSLDFDVVINNSLSLHLGGNSENKITFSNISLDSKNQKNPYVCAQCALTKEIINIQSSDSHDLFNYSSINEFDRENKYHTKSLLNAPLLDQNNKILGVMQLINKLDENNQTISFDQIDEKIIKVLASQLSTAIVFKSQ